MGTSLEEYHKNRDSPLNYNTRAKRNLKPGTPGEDSDRIAIHLSPLMGGMQNLGYETKIQQAEGKGPTPNERTSSGIRNSMNEGMM